MNTNHLKSLAPDARASLIEQISARVDYLLSSDSVEHRERANQIDQLRSAVASEGKDALVNRIAYTWFNRISALRLMDAHGFHPAKVRIITAIEGFTQPEILQQARSGELGDAIKLDRTRLHDVLSGKIPSSDPTNEAYRILLVAACHALTEIDPVLFPNSLNDAFSELLLPADLLSNHSVLAPFRNEITDEDCADVEILGWLYQFYISAKKDEVMARKKAVPTEDIPYVTQLFTPNWIVRYMVENSLGRLWMANRPSSSLAKQMPYYIPAEEGETIEVLKILTPEEIKIIDPAVGSGHILSYAFDLLYLIYEEEGYTPSDIPGLILENNLYGVDICPRAAQLAELSLLFKARQKSRRFFTSRKLVRPQILNLQDIDFDEGELETYIESLDLGPLFTEPVLKQLYQFKQSTTFGSLIQPLLDQSTLAELRELIRDKDLGSELFLKPTHDKVIRALDQAEMLSQRYHCVIANPPYMGGKQMNADVKTFAKNHYKEAKADLFAMFIERGFTLSIPSGYNAMVTMQSWMFLSSFEAFRNNLIKQRTIVSMAHLGARGFDSIGGEVVQTTAFVTCNVANEDYPGAYFRLTEGKSEKEKSQMFLDAVEAIRP